MRPLIVLLFCLTMLNGTLPAQVAPTLSYQGRVTVHGTNFPSAGGTAIGKFKFALVSQDGSYSYWSNDGANPPVQQVPLSVSNGLYSVPLGDTALPNMTALPPAVFSTANLFLRVWFDDGSNGSQLLSPDQRVSAVAYAIAAGSASTAQTVSPGGVGAAQLAANAVQGVSILDGSVSLRKLSPRSPSSTAAEGGIALSPVFSASTTSTTPATFTDASATLSTTGRPVMVTLTAANTGASSEINAYVLGNSLQGDFHGFFAIYRDNQPQPISVQALHSYANNPGSQVVIGVPPGTVSAIDFPSAGAHTYELRIYVDSAAVRAQAYNIRLMAFEL